ncbi:MAG: 23S rRNA pseudouridine(2605) synthase RluB [Thiohalomonadaceae bacterium]
MNEKLQKVLARIGLGSRRELEQWISDGRVSVNGKVATLGDRVGPGDVVRVDGHIIGQAAMLGPERRVLVYHKPLGEVCTRSDPEKRPTIFEKMPSLRNGRWVAVGRLDVNTTGVILLTTDGELANRLMHPSSHIEREYAVRVFGEVSPEVIQKLRDGVMLDDGQARFDDIIDAGGDGANHWYHVILHEGRNREVRRLWESQGVTVSRLIRVRYGPVQLGRRLRPGRYEELAGETLQALLQQVGLARPKAKAVVKKAAGGRDKTPRQGRATAERPAARQRRDTVDDWSTSPHPPAAPRKGRGTQEGRPGAARSRPASRKPGAEGGERPRRRAGDGEASPPPRRAPAARKPAGHGKRRR